MAEKTIVLWGIGTMRTLRPLWLAREMGIDYELKPARPRTGDTHTAEFLELNPRHKVPVLCHRNLVLTESAAILNYLCEAFAVPDHFYTPADAASRAKLNEWCLFCLTELDSIALYTIRMHGDLTEIYGEAPVAVEAAKQYFHHQIDAMEQRLKSATPFLMGDQVSIADIILVSCLDFARAQDLTLPDYLADYRRSLRRRQAYALSYADNYPGRKLDEND